MKQSETYVRDPVTEGKPAPKHHSQIHWTCLQPCEFIHATVKLIMSIHTALNSIALLNRVSPSGATMVGVLYTILNKA